MRIIAGINRGINLTTTEGRNLRPTSDRVRESLFNILDGGKYPGSYKNKLVIDAFAGTGAVGLEALSRGAGHVIFYENSVKSLEVLHKNIRSLKASHATTVLNLDATKIMRPSDEKAGLIILDPPYNSGLSIPCANQLRTHGWIDKKTLIVLEHATKEVIGIPKWMVTLESRRYGSTSLTFLRCDEN